MSSLEAVGFDDHGDGAPHHTCSAVATAMTTTETIHLPSGGHGSSSTVVGIGCIIAVRMGSDARHQ